MTQLETGRGAAVISIAGYRAGHELDALDTIERYWQQIRQTQGTPPARPQLDPRGFSKALSNCFVAEAVAPCHLRLRVAGQHLHELMGMDMRGMPLSALLLPESRPELERRIESLLDGSGTPVRLGLISPRSYGRQALFAGLLLLPLARENGLPPRILGALSAVGTVGWTPRRFQILGDTPPSATPDPNKRPALRVIEGGMPAEM